MQHKRPWFKFWVADYLMDSKVQAMSLVAQGAYIRLLCVQWSEGSLPDDVEEIARFCRLTTREIWAYHLAHWQDTFPDSDWVPEEMPPETLESIFEREIWPDLEGCFPLHSDGRRRNPRLENERQAAAARERANCKRTENARKSRHRNKVASKEVSSVTDNVTERIARVSESESDADERKDEDTCFRAPQAEELEKAVRQWNLAAPQLGAPVVRKLTASRKRTLAQRLREDPGFMAHVIAAAERSSEFLAEGRWFCFDWVLKPANATKLLEGNYEPRKPPPTPEEAEFERERREAYGL